MKKLALAVLLGIALTGCASPAGEPVEQEEAVCDSEDYYERDSDCGYYDPDTGAWIYYYWVVAGVGGSPPRDFKPNTSHRQKPPRVQQPTRPRNNPPVSRR